MEVVTARTMVYVVTRYGWAWAITNPTPERMRQRLVAAWLAEMATECSRESYGRRDIRV